MNTQEYLARFTRILYERGIAADPVLAVVRAVGIENVFLGVGTLSGHLQLLIPARADALALVAPGATLPQRTMLLVSARAGAPITAGVVIGGAANARQAVDEVGPAAARPLWLPIIESLMSLAGGAIRNRTRCLDEERGTITIPFSPRDDARQAVLGCDLATLAERLGVTARWRLAYDDVGPDADFSVTTECVSSGPAARLALRCGPAAWDQVIDLGKAILGVDEARAAAVCMGTLAGALEIDDVRGVEAVFDAVTTDLVVWLKLG